MELDTCSHCALCTEMCPAYNESKNHLHAPGVRTSIVLKLYDKKHGFLTRIFGEKKIGMRPRNSPRPRFSNVYAFRLDFKTNVNRIAMIASTPVTMKAMK